MKKLILLLCLALAMTTACNKQEEVAAPAAEQAAPVVEQAAPVVEEAAPAVEPEAKPADKGLSGDLE